MKSLIYVTDNFLDSTHKKDKSSIFSVDSNLGSTHTKEISSLHITDLAEYHRVYSNPHQPLIMIARKVLPNPVVIPEGQNYTFTYTIDTSQISFAEADNE